jgi:hypothetical protein
MKNELSVATKSGLNIIRALTGRFNILRINLIIAVKTTEIRSKEERPIFLWSFSTDIKTDDQHVISATINGIGDRQHGK